MHLGGATVSPYAGLQTETTTFFRWRNSKANPRVGAARTIHVMAPMVRRSKVIMTRNPKTCSHKLCFVFLLNPIFVLPTRCGVSCGKAIREAK